jgi:hypothetical protein
MNFSSCKIPRHKKPDGSYIFSDALPLLLRTRVRQEKWAAFVHELNSYKRRRIKPSDVFAGASIIATVSVLCGAFFGLTLPVGQACLVGFFAFVLLVITNIPSDSVDRIDYLLHLAAVCNTMNKRTEMADAEAVLAENGDVTVQIK